ncbi:MAG: DUF4129 domain-containing protein [Cyanobacteria bacterium J06632_22]
MAAESIQTSTLGWQVRLLTQRLGEWIELLLSGQEPSNEPPPEFTLPAWVGTVLLWTAVTATSLLLAWIIYQIVVYLLANRATPRPTTILTALIEPEPARTAAEWLREAKRLEAAGDWRGACRALYMAALQTLSDRGWIAAQASRTDGEYLTALETTAHPITQPRPYQLLIRTHERGQFSDQVLTAENLQRCRRAYQEIEKP